MIRNVQPTLSGNFVDQLSTIFRVLPTDRQTLLFTATNTPVVGETIAACPNNPHVWECETTEDQKTVETLDQRFVLTPMEARNGYLVQLVLDNR